MKLTSFVLKIIGVITMLSDHIGDSIIGKFSFLNLIGRIAFPIFAFQAVQGFIHTKDFKKHMRKLLIFACISQIPFMLFLSTFTDVFALNIFFTFFLGLLALFLYEKSKHKMVGFLWVVLISILGKVIHVDYGAFGILLIFCFYIFQNKKSAMIISTILLCIFYYLPNIISSPTFWLHYSVCILFTFSSLFFLVFYNHKEGPKAKYFFYVFYPLHLIILYLLHMALYS